MLTNADTNATSPQTEIINALAHKEFLAGECKCTKMSAKE